MKPSDRVRHFEAWAGEYDEVTRAGEHDFPFDGYELVLSRAVEQADPTPDMRILDLGIGTGNLALRFARQGCTIWGIDFSAHMLAQARSKLPEAHLVQADLLDPWPALVPPSFDRVVSAYTFHEFDLDTKVRILRRVVDHYVAAGGRIVRRLTGPGAPPPHRGEPA